jgi:hypothetical protein
MEKYSSFYELKKSKDRQDLGGHNHIQALDHLQLFINIIKSTSETKVDSEVRNAANSLSNAQYDK